MRIVYLIGNGFDRQARLPTEPKTIVDNYKESLGREIEHELQKESPDVSQLMLLQTIHSAICDNYNTWGDFERALGSSLAIACRKASDEASFYERAVEHFTQFLYRYISELNERIEDFQIAQDIDSKFHHGAVSCMKDGMRNNHKQLIESMLQTHENENWICSFINFNYTTLIDRMVEISRSSGRVGRSIHNGSRTYTRKLDADVLHIHGNITDGHGIITGVDNPSQIEVPEFRDVSTVNSSVVKPQLNIDRGDLVEQATLNLIDRADIICIFGMAMGVTDRTWWKAITDWLDAGDGKRILAINAWGKESDVYPGDHRRIVSATLDSFFFGAGVSDASVRKRLEPSIVVSRNSKVFDFGIDLSKPLT